MPSGPAQRRPSRRTQYALIDLLPVPVTECSRDLRYVWANPAYLDWIGRPARDVLDRPIEEVLGPDVCATLRPHIDRVLSGERTEYESELALPGKGRRWVHATYTPTHDEDGSIRGWVAVVLDVDERRRIENALRESDLDLRHLAAIVDHSDDAIVSKDTAGHITSWNRAAERMYGYTAAEAVGQSVRLIVPTDRQSEEDHVLASIHRGQRIDHFETLRRRKDGTLIPVSLTVSPIRDATGAVVGASKIARDISERRRAEASDARARRHDALLSKATAALTGARTPDDTLRALAPVIVPDIADWCAIDRLIAEDQIRTVAVSHIDPDRVSLIDQIRREGDAPPPFFSPRHVIRTGAPVLIARVTAEMIAAAGREDENWIRLVQAVGIVSYLSVPLSLHGRPLGALTMATTSAARQFDHDDLRLAEDLAARAALAVDNATAYEQLETANRLKDEFLATLSHELRTPLNAVVGYARLLRSGTVPAERMPQMIEVMDRNATALTQIVEDVLDVSRIMSGKSRLRVQPVDVGQVLRDAVATIMPAAEAKGVRVQTVFEAEAAVSGDPDRLQQVFWNVLSNAVRFTPRSGRVQVRLQRVNSHVEVVVTDTGIGIPAWFLPHVFERFRQAEGGTNRQHGGLGLGLAIARHVVEMHGGTIHAASDGVGTGATFRIHLPVMIVHREPYLDEDRVHPQRPTTPSVRPPANLTGTHVLAVDDDEDALALLTTVLEHAGARVTTASSAEAGLERLARERPNVLIADLGMPVMNGFDFIQRVRQSADPAIRRIPAAALTAYARSEDRAKALNRGFEMHLSKPISPSELVAAVEALARRSPRDEPL
jgi:PAS domain S-box-containing protein